MSETQAVYKQIMPWGMTKEELLFAQMRGVLLHLLDREMGYFGEWNRLVNGEDALIEFHIHAEQYGYHSLQEQFYQVPEGNEQFIAYWESFLPDVGGEDYEYSDDEEMEPDVDDSFPLELEYPEENRIEMNSFDHWLYYESEYY